MGTYFLSYSRDDGDDHSFLLRAKLQGLRRGFKVIRDQEDLPPGLNWQQRLATVIPDCDALLFLMTGASVTSDECMKEWTWAKGADIPTIPLRFVPVDLPFWAQNVTWVDFTEDYEESLSFLIVTLHNLQAKDPQRRLQTLKDRRQAAERQLHEGSDPETGVRARKRVALYQRRIDEQQWVASNPERARQDRDHDIDQHLAVVDNAAVPAERAQERPGPLPPVPAHFRDRRTQRQLLAELLRDEAVRLVVVTGPEGIGKSAVVGRVLRAARKGGEQDLGPLEVTGTVYLETRGIRRFTVSSMLTDLRDLLPEDARERLRLLMDKSVPLPTKLRWLVKEFGNQRVVVLIDNFERLVDPTTWEIRDTELDTVLVGLLREPSQAIKVVLTSQRRRNGLDEFIGSGRMQPVGILEGLDPADAGEVLRALDRDGSAGLRDAADELIDKAVRLTRGHPKALEALYALLWKGEVSLEEIAVESRTPNEVAAALIGRTFDGLEREERQALQALAVFGLPVRATAVDLLLRPYPPYSGGLRARQVLDRLVSMYLVRRRGELFELALMDREWVLDRILPGDATDRKEDPPPFTIVALMRHGADYFHEERLPDDRCYKLDDLRFHLAEIDLRTRGGEHGPAIALLIDVAHTFLFNWGHADEALKWLQPLDVQVTSQLHRMLVSGTVGLAHRLRGEHEEALNRYHSALELAVELGNLENQAVILTNIGACHYVLGQANEAAEAYRQAIELAQLAENRSEEAAALSNLGLCLVESGAFDEATRLYEQAREIGESADQVDDQLTAQQWFNLGIVQVELGDHERAIRCFKQSVHCAPDAPTMELRRGRYLQGWAEVLLDQDDADRAVKVAREAVKISREIGSATLRRDANYVLAMALLQRHVLDDDPEALEAARLAVDASCEFSPGTRGHAAFALRGLIALRRGRREDAMDGFLKAERFGRTALEHGARNYSALDSRGLALAGLALLARTRLDDGDGLQLAMALQLRVDDSRELSELAVQVYREARIISSHSGVVRRVGRQLDALPDPDGILAGVRSVAISPPLAGDDSARISG